MTHPTPPSTAAGARAAHSPSPSTASALVNGAPYPLPAATTVAALVAALLPELVGDTGDVPRGVAVAIDDAVLPRSTWSSTILRDGDRVEVVTAVQGG
ncbi:sulfur carrier protein ThiS [Oerskovia enterophila]|uniref:sulfur carrier protein ThiS n=1 Tax=Oerskovia enterophila TaxID=43678 RepID=UPI0033979EAE